MDAALVGRLINPFAQNALDQVFNRAVAGGHGASATLDTALADSISLDAAAASPQQILNTEILRALDEALSAEGGPGLDHRAGMDAYTPEKVADRILGFIGSVTGQEADAGRRSELMEQARAGIEEGFAEARDILDGLDILNGDIANTIDQTYALIQEGLARFESAGLDDEGNEQHADDRDGGEQSGVTQSGFIAASYNTRQTTSLVVNTLEGDRVTIDISKQATSSRTAVAGAAGESGFESTQTHREASVNFSFSVQGELSDDERKAVDELIQRIDKVSDKFFDGNVQAAFSKAAHLKFDGEELAGYSLSLSSSQTYRAVAAYQQTQPPGTEHEAASPVDAAALGGEVQGLIEDAASSTPLAEPARDVATIFTTLVDERASSFGFESLQADAMSMLQDLVNRIVDNFEAKKAVSSDEEDATQGRSEQEQAA